ncbi:hypothetical protein CB1_001133001 [Camelus ferus]|nr:hypothetical protein CB1_001133001 [Camelus ferus]
MNLLIPLPVAQDVLQCTMITHQILLRGAAQCYLLQTAMNLVDVLCDWLCVNESCFRRASIGSSTGLHETSTLNAYVKSLVQEYIKSPAWDHEVFTLLQNFILSTSESISEFILRRLTMNELNSISDLDRCRLYLTVLTELINLHLKVGWKRGNPIWRVISPLKNASMRHLQEMNSGQEPTLGRQIQGVVSMASLAMVCEATDQKPELQLDSLDAGPMERLLCSLPLNQTLQKPRTDGESSSSGDSRGGRASLSLRVTSRGAGPLSLVAQGSENESPRRLSLAVLGEENLKTSICTFLSVLSHLDIVTENIPEKKLILKQALIIVLHWCFNHNFSIRLYALIALKKIWGMCKALHLEELDALTSVIESSLNQVENMQGAGNAKKNWQRIQEHFFFAAFHPLKDYCLETIFYILPRLSGLVEDEWISIGKFTKFTDIPLDAGFQWYRSPTQLCELKPGDWAQQDIGSNSGEADNQSEWTDVQKKIIPWKNNVPDLDLELVFQDRAAKLGKSISRLIVVASLIDKPTNLGGLCRTCEVFGASALAVGNLQCIRDRQFQHLSVSAEQWLPLVEVRPPQLIDYLQQKKAEGYTIVGVEQTVKSVDLTQYCFPEKSLLLLGNEREGIPANLIQQLDVCVEIPQQGIIRSLNVHVSGALLIWEYTRQQLLRHGVPVARSSGLI